MRTLIYNDDICHPHLQNKSCKLALCMLIPAFCVGKAFVVLEFELIILEH